ncbi:phosphoribosyl-AMP cyclohydrolase [Pararhizobium mangrovi]|uniref:Phosphoribosyl-AMP cyclohydrolase n=1 Tax=Pararhizobium mangrovi TaxID=2590452 RepID=A0A506UDN4_9HYPH|nr:phosphoribosyl-AMP cyclohydrolase [Pararhizobium mangrovi]TPW31241.1 phosphoribosyl-AMP cyclohydrolase [Pararhizobium mangrovi]
MTDRSIGTPIDEAEREMGATLAPRFDANGLVTAVVTDADDGTVLMLAHMDADALARTIKTGEAHFFSRSRRRLWKKGETSGNVLDVETARIDCDQDAVWLTARIRGSGVACHTGARSCFYRRIESGPDGKPRLVHETSR